MSRAGPQREGGRRQRGVVSLLGVAVLLALLGGLSTAAWHSARLQQRMAQAALTRARLVEVADDALAEKEARAVWAAGLAGRCVGTVILEASACDGSGREVRLRVELALREGAVVEGDAGGHHVARARACTGRRSAWTRVE
jgi:Tfp pilus assembly protein PilX